MSVENVSFMSVLSLLMQGIDILSVAHKLRKIRTYLMNPKKEISTKLTAQPAVAKALGIVRAPVPTIRLNIYTNPTYRRHKQHGR